MSVTINNNHINSHGCCYSFEKGTLPLQFSAYASTPKQLSQEGHALAKQREPCGATQLRARLRFAAKRLKSASPQQRVLEARYYKETERRTRRKALKTLDYDDDATRRWPRYGLP